MPELAMCILVGNALDKEPKINLKGFLAKPLDIYGK